ncbi:MAG: NAD(P)H-quinone oxidoreductase [Saprospiraceae bacterium]
MQAILVKQAGGPDQLGLGQAPIPILGPEELLVEVAATALNRADLLQRAGHYPPPKGESPILGLELAGTVVEKGINVHRWKKGDRVCGLVGGGAYAQYAKIHQDMALSIPDGLNFQEAAAIPEVFLTAYQAIHWLSKLEEQERILIHAGASGVGTAAIQLAARLDAEIFVTASSHKHHLCRDLGAHYCIDYKEDSFSDFILDLTEGQGVQVVIDFIAADYFKDNLKVLSRNGRMVMLALLGGHRVEAPSLMPILMKHLTIMGSTLRSRSLEYKIALSKDLQKHCWTGFETGALKPVIDSIFPLAEVRQAHERMEANKNQGKIILTVKG